MPLPVYGRVDLVIEHILQLFEEALALFVVILFQGTLELLQGLTLGAAELLGDLDLALDVHITAASAIHILDALAAQAEGGAALGAFRHIDLDLAVDGRHRDGIAQDSLTVGDGEDDVDVVLVALEHLAGLDSHRHDDVTCGAAVGAGIAHAREAEALIVVDARRDIGLQSLLDRDGAAAVAALAGVLDELALAAAAGAGLLGLHDAEGRTLLTNDKASAAAVRAGLRAGTGGAAAAVALGTLLLTGDGDVLLAAMHRLVKRQGDAHPDVLALAGGVGIRRTARAAKTAEAAAKDVAENIAKVNAIKKVKEPTFMSTIEEIKIQHSATATEMETEMEVEFATNSETELASGLENEPETELNTNPEIEPENVSEENILVDEISTVQATEAPATSQSKSPCDDPESPNRDLQ